MLHNKIIGSLLRADLGLPEDRVEFGTGKFIEHAFFRWQPGANQRRSLQFVLNLVVTHNGAVILSIPLILFLFLLKLPESLHFLRSLGYNGGQIDLLPLGFLLQSRKLFHELIILMPLLDKIVPIGSEQPIDFYITKNKPYSMERNSSLLKNYLITLEIR